MNILFLLDCRKGSEIGGVVERECHISYLYNNGVDAEKKLIQNAAPLEMHTQAQLWLKAAFVSASLFNSFCFCKFAAGAGWEIMSK